MKYLWITSIPPFQPLLDFDIKGINIDLHNDFGCININANNSSIEFSFLRTVGNEFYKEQNAVIIFNDIIECNIELLKQNRQLGDITTLTNFAKGALSEDHKYYDAKDISYFFLDFFEGELIEILCKEGIIFLW